MQKMKTVMDSTLSADPAAAERGPADEARCHSKGASGHDECQKRTARRDAAITRPDLGAMGERRRAGSGRRRFVCQAGNPACDYSGRRSPRQDCSSPSWQFRLEFRFNAVYWNPATDDVKHRKSVRG